MRDCQHLIIGQPVQINPGIWAAPDPECDLKVTVPVRLAMAADAQAILGVPCPPNNTCHYHPHDRCEDCPQYAPPAQPAAAALHGIPEQNPQSSGR